MQESPRVISLRAWQCLQARWKASGIKTHSTLSAPYGITYLSKVYTFAITLSSVLQASVLIVKSPRLYGPRLLG